MFFGVVIGYWESSESHLVRQNLNTFADIWPQIHLGEHKAKMSVVLAIKPHLLRQCHRSNMLVFTVNENVQV
jgi:hypothetical protein